MCTWQNRILICAAGLVAGWGIESSAQVVTADGKLPPEIKLLLTDQNPKNGIPDILEDPVTGKRRPVFIGEQWLPIIDDCTTASQDVDGFTDEPSNETFGQLAKCNDFNSLRARVPLNYGKITVIYVLDPENDVDPNKPSTDQSFLYVGLDICNGNPTAVAGDLGTWKTDFQLPPDYNNLCRYGLPAEGSDPNKLLWFMVPFDGDGDGDPTTAKRMQGYPERSFELYGFNFFTCEREPNVCIQLPNLDNQVVSLRLSMNPPGSGLDDAEWGSNVEDFGDLRNVALRFELDPFDPNDDIVIDDANDPRLKTTFLVWPPVGTDPNTIAGWGQAAFNNPNDPNRSILDVELIVRRFESFVNQRYPDDPPSTNRKRAAQGLLRLVSDNNSDNTGEDIEVVPWFISLPEIEVKKEVRCVNPVDPNANPWRETAVALPADPNEWTVEFRVTVENTGNVPLRVTLTDVLQKFGAAGYVVDRNYVKGTFFGYRTDPNCPADPNLGVSITLSNAACFGLSGLFFDEGEPDDNFAGGVATGEPRFLGCLQPVKVCPAYIPGDKVVIVVRARLTGCTPGSAIEIKNLIKAEGGVCDPNDPNWPLFDPVVDNPDPNGPRGRDPRFVDTPREKDPNQGYDDNVVSVDLLCRDVRFEKDIRYCPDCNDCNPADPNHPGFADRASFPDITFEGEKRCIIYRYKVSNYGEIVERVTVSDPNLCADISTINAQYPGGITRDINCEVCPSGTAKNVPAKVGNNPGVAYWTCKLTFNKREALAAFLKLDDNRQFCDNKPREGYQKDTCYTNCGKAVARALPAAEVCDGAPDINLEDQSTFCVKCCYIDVTKDVACVDPNGVVGPYDPNRISALPGSRIRFRVDVKNTGPDPNDRICSLRITDCLKTASGGPYLPCAAYVDGTARFWILPSNKPCPTPPGFNIDCTPFEFDPTTCGETFDPGEVIRMEFDVDIAPDADPNICDLINEVKVECAAECEPEPAYCSFDTDDARVDVKRAALECKKYWAAKWDKNADCDPNDPNNVDGYIDYTDNLDLSDRIVFPVMLFLKVEVKNTGEVPLDVQALDPKLCDAVKSFNGKGVYFNDQNTCDVCRDGNEPFKRIDPNQTVLFTCQIYIASAEGLRQLAKVDGGTNENLFENTVTAKGVPAGSGFCPPYRKTEISTFCDATVIPPLPCDIIVKKFVRCVPDCNACPNWNPTDPNDWRGLQEAAAQSCVQWLIEIENVRTQKVRLPLLKIKDAMSPDRGFRNCRAILVDPDNPNNYVDLTACVCPNLKTNGTEFSQKFSDAVCRPAAPWMEPGERLLITFCSTLGAQDVANVVDVSGFSEACGEEACSGPKRATANVKIVRAAMSCIKTVAVDYKNDGTIDLGPASNIEIDGNDAQYKNGFPMRLVYTFTVQNDSTDIPLKGIRVKDAELIKDVLAVNPGGIISCFLDANGEFADPGFILIPADKKRDLGKCEFLMRDEPDLDKLFVQDGEPNICYKNTVTMWSAGDWTGRCPPPDPNLTTECSAELCRRRTECPKVKVVATIINQNEIQFSGTERCIKAWEERLLSRFTVDMPPYKGSNPPNNFTRHAIQTDLGRARLNGMASTLCPDSIDAPIIGVMATLMTVNNDPNNAAVAGVEIHGSGYEDGELVVLDLGSGPGGRSSGSDASGGAAASVPGAGGRENAEVGPVERNRFGTGEHRIGDEGGPLDNDPNQSLVISAVQKGSLLVYPKVDIKFDAQGKLVQDTFIALNNDWAADVRIIAFFVNGQPDSNEVCNVYRNNEFAITHNQPIYWSAFTGKPFGVSPFTVLGQPVPDYDPFNPGGTHLHGYIVLWAVDAEKREVRWNHLSGAATLVNYKYGEAWEYNAFAFRAHAGTNEGDLLLAPYGTLSLNGKEYDRPPDRLLLDFFTIGTEITSGPGKTLKVLDTDLALWIAENNYVE